MSNLDSTDLFFALGACIAAILFGISLAKRQANAFKGISSNEHPAVTFADYGDMRFLHLGSPAVQGSMKLSKPFEIHLQYVQRMMAWLLFVELDQVHQLRAMQLGLGAGALTKFCYHQLGMHTTALELNPQVIDVCRNWFHLPQNSERLHVVQADATHIGNNSHWLGQIDVLQVDLYDPEAKRPVLDTVSFYRDCHALLTGTGCMVVNVFGQDSNVRETVQKMSQIFRTDAIWAFSPTTAGNSIVLAFAAPPQLSAADLHARALAIEARWSLPATEWLRVLAPAH